MRSLLFLAAAAPVAAVTPVEKVINLLVKLEAKVEQEGKDEAVAYDKFACFCKEQADNKQYAIEKSEEKIELLSARIEKLATDIEEHNNIIAENEKKIDETTKRSEEETAKRKEEREAYEKKDAQYARAISATERATAALKESGGSASFVQTSMNEARKLASAFENELSADQFMQLQKLNQEPAAYNYHSSEIISVLQGLTKTFKQKKKQLFNAEANTKQTFNLEEQTRQHQIKVMSERVATNKDEAAQKDAEKNDKQDQHDQEVKDKDADSGFLKELTGQCEAKAKLFDQRSQSRVAELKALNEGLALLKAEGGQNYTANKKLTALTQSSVASTDDDLSYLEDDSQDDSEEAATSDDEESTEEPESFIQTRSINERKVLKLLGQKAKLLKSTALAALTVRLQKDHFAKVRALIKDLVTRLEEQAKSEETAQSLCKDNMTAAMKKRDDSRVSIERLNGEISGLENKIAETNQNIKDLQAAIADLNKALAEQTDLRNAESKTNKQTIADADAGRDAVANAIDILNNYYGAGGAPTGGSFLQKGRQAPGPGVRGADRSGDTVADLAPDTFDEEYRGSQGESKGIIGILEVIKTDYQRTSDETQADEDTAQAAFEKFSDKTKADIGEKEDSVKQNRETLATAEDDLATAQDNHAEETEINKLANEELNTLKASCIDTEISYEERVKRREQEISALKEALAILEEMSFLQKRK